MHSHPFILQTLAAGQTDDAGWVLAVFAVLSAIGTGIFAFSEFRRRKAAEAQLGGVVHIQREQGQQLSERDSTMFKQHKQMNELQINKLAAEVEILQAQAKAGVDLADRHEASKEYHELMVEKTRLEMDALRLQIAEHRRRMEDWRSDD